MRELLRIFCCLLLFSGGVMDGVACAEETPTPPPLNVQLKIVGEGLEVRLHLQQELPKAFTDTLPSGAVVTVVYPLRLRKQRWWIWDGTLWKGELTARTAFDPITGRYRCELLLDEIMVASEERDTADGAADWLAAPPAFRVVVEGLDARKKLYFRARAVFSTSTTLLIFPDTTGTDWVSVPLVKMGPGDVKQTDRPVE